MKYPPVFSSTRGPRPAFSGHVVVQGRLRLLCNGEKAFSIVDLKDRFQYKGYWSRFGGHPLHVQRVEEREDEIGRVCSHETKSGKVSGEGRVECDRKSDIHGRVNHEDDDYDGGEIDELSCFRGLVLDVSYRPINVVCWRRAICLEFMEKADVLEYYDQTVSSPSGSFYIPAVLRVPNLLQVVKRRRVRQQLSRKNVFFRDAFTCQYCSSRDNLTIDHVLPISRGGEWTWENLACIHPAFLVKRKGTYLKREYGRLMSQVTACSRCNSRKGGKTLEEASMKLIKAPKAPKEFDIHGIPLTTAALKVLKMRKGFPDEWRQYLAQPSSEP